MDEDNPPLHDRLREFLRGGVEQQMFALDDSLEAASLDDKKAVLHSLKQLVDSGATTFEPLLPVLTMLLEADDRAVRLTTAKLLVSIAEAEPETVLPLVSVLTERLSDEEEFYYVRARAAEALGYVALERSDGVASPEVVADLRVGLSFDEPEVKQKLAKALEYVALGDPRRLRYHVEDLAEQLSDEDELVRYHICTALAGVGAQYPERLAGAADELSARLDDECSFVRGRAAEALGQLADEGDEQVAVAESRLVELIESDESFVVTRARYAYSHTGAGGSTSEMPTGIGTIERIRETTADIAKEIESPDDDGGCPHCGLSLLENGPPMCPRCGGPY